METKTKPMKITTKWYIALSIIILVSAVSVPFFAFFSYFIAPAFTSLILIIRRGYYVENGFGSLIMILLGLFMIVLIRFLISFFKLSQGRREEFDRESRGSFIFSSVIMALFWALQLIDNLRVERTVQNYNFSEARAWVPSLLQLRAGFWIIFICSLIGAFLPSILKLFNKNSTHQEEATTKNHNIPSNINLEKSATNVLKKAGELVENGKDFVAQVSETITNNNSKDLITLVGKNQNLNLFELPVILGNIKDDSDIFLEIPDASTIKIEFLLYEGDILISDRGSSVDIFLNTEKLTPGEFYKLINDDRLRIDSTDFTVNINDKQLKQLNKQ